MAKKHKPAILRIREVLLLGVCSVLLSALVGAALAALFRQLLLPLACALSPALDRAVYDLTPEGDRMLADIAAQACMLPAFFLSLRWLAPRAVYRKALYLKGPGGALPDGRLSLSHHLANNLPFEGAVLVTVALLSLPLGKLGAGPFALLYRFLPHGPAFLAGLPLIALAQLLAVKPAHRRWFFDYYLGEES